MNKTTEALAVKALEMIAGERMCINNLLSDKDIAREALAAIREALSDHIPDATKMVAEPVKQEPVFWYRPIDEDVYEGPVHNDSVCGKMWRDEKPGEWLPLYAAPVQPVKQEPVACDVIDKCISLVGTEMVECKESSDTWFLCQRLVHAMQDMQYELKNAAPVQPVKQEPVAWTNYNGAVNNRLKGAPAQPVKQEPVAWHEPNAYGNVTTHKKWAEENGWLPLYTKE